MRSWAALRAVERKLAGTYVGYQLDNPTSGSTATYENMALGAAPAAGERRFIVLACGAFHSTGKDAQINSATVDGVSATLIARASQNNATSGSAGVAIFWLEVPTGTTATTITVVHNTSLGYECGLSIYRLVTGPAGPALPVGYTDTGRPLDFTIANGFPSFAVGVAMNRNGSLHTWTGLTENVDVDTSSNDVFSTASKQFTSAGTGVAIQANSSSAGNEHAGAVAVFNAYG